MKHIDSYSHIIWDFNGTILDDLELCLDIQLRMMTKRGIAPMSREVYLDTFSFPIRDWYARMGYDVSEYDRIAAQWAAIYEAEAGDCAMNDGFLTLCDGISGRGVRQSILSACWQEQLDALVSGLGIAGRFEHVCGLSNLLGESKTNAGRALARKIGAGPHRMLLVGDTLHDLDTAIAIGCDCALVAVGHQSYARLKSRWDDVFLSFGALAGALNI